MDHLENPAMNTGFSRFDSLSIRIAGTLVVADRWVKGRRPIFQPRRKKQSGNSTGGSACPTKQQEEFTQPWAAVPQKKGGRDSPDKVGVSPPRNPD